MQIVLCILLDEFITKEWCLNHYVWQTKHPRDDFSRQKGKLEGRAARSKFDQNSGQVGWAF